MLVVQDPNDKSLPAMQILENAVRRGNLGSLMVDPTFFVTKNGGMNNHKNHEHQAYVTGYWLCFFENTEQKCSY